MARYRERRLLILSGWQHLRSFATLAAIRSASWLAQEACIESRIAWRGNYTPGGCETSKNVALTCDYGLAKLNCVSFTTAHNILRHCMTSWGNPSLCEAREHVVC